MIKQDFEFTNKYGYIIKGCVRFKDDNNLKPAVIFLHGFKSFKNWGFIPFTCEQLAEKNYIAISFDFSLNGIVDEDKPWFDPELFSKQTISSHVTDFEDITKLITSHSDILGNSLDKWNGKIFTIGHSMGGAISLLGSQITNKTDKIVLWASVSRLDRNTVRQKEIWKKSGFADVKISITGQVLPLDYNYIIDKEDNFKGKSIVENTQKIEVPVLILHAEHDLIVKKNEAQELFSAVNHNQKSKLIVIGKTGHTFGEKHPFEGPGTAFNNVLNNTFEFLEEE
jgi:alpha-beta hydrolase superfamily lysophospholipase